jgi:hypothetical protein
MLKTLALLPYARRQHSKDAGQQDRLKVSVVRGVGQEIFPPLGQKFEYFPNNSDLY